MPYFPFENNDGKPRVGLKMLDLKDWIEIDDQRAKQIGLKKQILQNHAETVLHVLPGAEEWVRELREVLGGHLVQHHNFQFMNGTLTTPENESYAPVTDAKEALKQIASWTQEDWAILSPRTPVKLLAAAICFPSRWNPKDKIGKESDGIHELVPHFQTIAKPTLNFLERLAPDKPMWRLNWTIHDSDQLFCPVPHAPVQDLKKDDILSRTWLRIERQTLRRLPQTGAVVFSIRTYLHKMNEVVADPDRRQRAAKSIGMLTEDSARYKGMRFFHRTLLEALT